MLNKNADVEDDNDAFADDLVFVELRLVGVIEWERDDDIEFALLFEAWLFVVVAVINKLDNEGVDDDRDDDNEVDDNDEEDIAAIDDDDVMNEYVDDIVEDVVIEFDWMLVDKYALFDNNKLLLLLWSLSW